MLHCLRAAKIAINTSTPKKESRLYRDIFNNYFLAGNPSYMAAN